MRIDTANQQRKTLPADFFRQCWKQNKQWVWGDVVFPLILTRFALLLVGWFSQYFLPDPNYPAQEAIKRGWHFSSYRLLDIWGRWDSGWYASIISNGYTLRGDIDTVQSNIAFFPLYPYIVKCLFQALPEQFRNLETMLLIGVIISNLFFLGALIIFHKLVVFTTNNQRTARRAVLYLLLFPTSFLFSCFYTESTYLFFSISSFYAASKHRWAIASILGCFVTLTRPLGVLILIPLIFDYLERSNWKISQIKGNIAWLLSIPATFLVFLL